MINQEVLELLRGEKNLLAFSYGIDSTALFFILLDEEIDFDIAIVDYGIREESKEEIVAAKKLAKRFNKEIFTKNAPNYDSNFEKNARDFRYGFFNEIVKEHSYTNLLTAHQLNDKLEWFFMQFSKGAGVCELRGLRTVTYEENYTLIRPLLEMSKESLKSYLKEKNEIFFEDSTNRDSRYRRNYFREHFSDRFLKEFGEGVKRSFTYIENECNYLLREYNPHRIKDLYILKRKEPLIEIKEIELTIKKMGYILSKPQKDEIERTGECVIGGVIAVGKSDESIFIAPFVSVEKMEKKFKEECRVLKIPTKNRGYIYSEEINLSLLK